MAKNKIDVKLEQIAKEADKKNAALRKRLAPGKIVMIKRTRR